MATLLLLLAALQVYSCLSLSLSKATFKTQSLRDGEKITKTLLTFTPPFSSTPAASSISVLPTQSLVVSASLSPTTSLPQQSVLRLYNHRLEIDNFFILSPHHREIRLDLPLATEIQGTRDFFYLTDEYSVELIIADPDLPDNGYIWTITKNLTFIDDGSHIFDPPSTGVFDFDVSVKTHAPPDFEWPIQPPEPRASRLAVIIGVIAVLTPAMGLLKVWSGLGVWKRTMNGDGWWKVFGVCVILHMIAMVRFWIGWRITTLWKVMSVLSIPTLFAGRKVMQ